MLAAAAYRDASVPVDQRIRVPRTVAVILLGDLVEHAPVATDLDDDLLFNTVRLDLYQAPATASAWPFQ